ncbi:MAG: plasmid pRiA4b ORF-3 family protein [Pseudomonadota bacterium]
MVKKKSEIYQIKITIKGSKPPIWRRVLVESDSNLDELHDVIQAVMNWEDYHLYHFFDKNTHSFYSRPDFELDDAKDSSRVKISSVLKKEKDKIEYEYDFGDSWEHEILLEKILPDAGEHKVPYCVTGKRAAPFEDCGGIWGYEDLCEIIKDPKHEEHADKLEWLGLEDASEFDPEHFDIKEINERLSEA